MIKICLIEDHKNIREDLRRIIKATSDMDIYREVGEAGECLYRCPVNNCATEIVLLEFSPSGQAGIDLLAELQVRYPHLSVLSLSLYPQGRWAEKALQAGAAGCITIGSAPERLIETIRAIASGNRNLKTDPYE